MKSKGFTLIELVVVIVILGILVGIGVPKYLDISAKAKTAADKGQLDALRGATHLLYASNVLAGSNSWPSAADVWAQLTKSNAWNGAAPTYADGVWTASWE